MSISVRKVRRVIAKSAYARYRSIRGSPLPRDLPQVQKLGCTISVIVPVHNTPPDILRECIQSVLEQDYVNWELCLCDDASSDPSTLAVVESFRGSDPRIRIVRSLENLHISQATNLAAEQATGRFLAFLDHDDRLHRLALYEIAKADLSVPDIDLLYTDEDKIDVNGSHCDSYLKPDWSPEHLDSVMYILHLLVVRKSLFWAIGGMRHELAGSQDYDLALRASSQARTILHIDRVLYHWRMIPGSSAAEIDAKPYALERARKALSDSLRARGVAASVEDGLFPGSFRVRRKIDGNPPVTLLVLTNHGHRDLPGRGSVDLLENFVCSIRSKSSYANHRIVVVDNHNASLKRRDWLKSQGVRLESHRYAPPFNFARKLNHALSFVESEQVVLLNDDLEVATTDWIESLLEFSQQPEIGVVGAQLLYPDGRIQHAGVVLGINGSAGHVFHGMPSALVGYNGYSHVVRNFSAVTGAVMATRMSIVRELGGFDEGFAIDFNDIDFCLRARRRGLRVVYTPYARLVHFEGSTEKRAAQNPSEVQRFTSVWANEIRRDPYYNVNLSRDSVQYAEALPPR